MATQRALVLAAVGLVPLLALAGCATPPSAGSEGPLVGQRAPSFSLLDSEGDAISLSAFRGRPVVLDLMGVNCAPCREEMPYLLRVASAVGGGKNGSAVLLSVDVGTKFPGLGARNAEEVLAFRSEFNATWHFARDDEASGVARRYNPLGVPTILVIGGDGIVRWRHDGGVVSDETLLAEIGKARS